MKELSKEELIKIIEQQKRIIRHKETEINKYRIDYLTGLYGRIDFESTIDNLWKKNKNFSMVLVDLIGLHNINCESYLKGDKALKDLSNQLKDVFRQSNIFRIGGDEFAVITMESKREYLNRIKKIPNLIGSRFVSSHSNDYTSSNFFKELDNKLNNIKNSASRIEMTLMPLSGWAVDEVLRF